MLECSQGGEVGDEPEEEDTGKVGHGLVSLSSLSLGEPGCH